MMHEDTEIVELERLAREIKALDKPTLSHEKKSLLKRKVLSRVDDPIMVDVLETVSNDVLDSYSRAQLKERIFAAIEMKRQRSFLWQNVFAYQKKFVAAFALVLMFFGAFNLANFDMGVVYAGSFTTLEDFNGDVVVRRGGELIELERGMQILESDEILTGEQGFASIKFFDDSVSRLYSNTQVTVNRLLKEGKVKTYVSLSLDEGMVWSRVVNLVDGQSVFSIDAMDLNLSTHRGAFNVEVDNTYQEIEVDVYNHSLNFEKEGSIGRLVNGQRLVSNQESYVLSKGSSNKDIAWVEKNLAEDKKHLTEVEKRLIATRKEVMGDKFNPKGDIVDKAALFLTFDDIDKTVKRLDMAERNLVAAQAVLADPAAASEDKELATAAIDDFTNEVEEFFGLIEEVSFTDEEYASELEAFVEDKIFSQKRDLSVVLPDSELYKVKEAMERLEMLTADSAEEAIFLRGDQASEKISIAQDALLLGDQEAAQKAVVEYKQKVDGVIAEVANGEQDVKDKVVDKVKEDVEQLESIHMADSSQLYEIKRDVATLEPVVTTTAVTLVIDSATGIDVGIDVAADPELTEGEDSTEEEQEDDDYALPPLLEF